MNPRRLKTSGFAAMLLVGVTLAAAPSPEHVSFPTQDDGVVHADIYGEGDHAVLLAHGGRFTKESWTDQAETLAEAGFRVMAIDFRGRGRSHGGPGDSANNSGFHFDVLAGVRYLQETGVGTVSVIGASFGGWAAARAAVEAKPGEIDRLVLLAATADEPERLQGRKLFILARDDVRGDGVPRLPAIRAQYERAPEPKELVILDGSAHAQFIFDTEQGEELMREILRFLNEP